MSCTGSESSSTLLQLSMRAASARGAPEFADLQLQLVQSGCATLAEALADMAEEALEFSSFVCYAVTQLSSSEVLEALLAEQCVLLQALLQALHAADERAAVLAAYALAHLAEDEPALLLDAMCGAQQQQLLQHLLQALCCTSQVAAAVAAEQGSALARQQLRSLTGAYGTAAAAPFAARALESMAQAAPDTLLAALLADQRSWQQLLQALTAITDDTARAAGLALRFMTQAVSGPQLQSLVNEVLRAANSSNSLVVRSSLEALHMMSIAAPSRLLDALLSQQQQGLESLLLHAASSSCSSHLSGPAAVGSLVLMAQSAAAGQMQDLTKHLLTALSSSGSSGSSVLQHGAAMALRCLAVNVPSQLLAALLALPQGPKLLLAALASSSYVASGGACSALRFVARSADDAQLQVLVAEVLAQLNSRTSSSLAMGFTALHMMAIAAPVALLRSLLTAKQGVQHVMDALGSCDQLSSPAALAAVELMARAAPGSLFRALLMEVLQALSRSNSPRTAGAAAVLSYLALATPMQLLEALVQQQRSLQSTTLQPPATPPAAGRGAGGSFVRRDEGSDAFSTYLQGWMSASHSCPCHFRGCCLNPCPTHSSSSTWQSRHHSSVYS